MTNVGCPEGDEVQFLYSRIGNKFNTIVLMAICQAALLLAIFIGVIVTLILTNRATRVSRDRASKRANECQEKNETAQPSATEANLSPDVNIRRTETESPESLAVPVAGDKTLNRRSVANISPPKREVPAVPLTYDYAYAHGRFCSARFNGEPESYYEAPIEFQNVSMP